MVKWCNFCLVLFSLCSQASPWAVGKMTIEERMTTIRDVAGGGAGTSNSSHWGRNAPLAHPPLVRCWVRYVATYGIVANGLDSNSCAMMGESMGANPVIRAEKTRATTTIQVGKRAEWVRRIVPRPTGAVVKGSRLLLFLLFYPRWTCRPAGRVLGRGGGVGRPHWEKTLTIWALLTLLRNWRTAQPVVHAPSFPPTLRFGGVGGARRPSGTVGTSTPGPKPSLWP